MVHAVDDRRVDVLTARRRDDDLLRAALQVGAGLFLGREEARALEHDVDAQLAPRQFCRVAVGQHADTVAVDDETGEVEVLRIVASTDNAVDKGTEVWLTLPPERCRALER